MEGGRSIPRRVVCVTGMPGCGKEEFIKVAKESGFDVVRMGDIVREEAARRGLDPGDKSVGGMANEERDKYGLGIWAVRTLTRIKGPRVIVDGIRGIAEIEVFRNAYPENLWVISIEASKETRFERIRRRKRKDATYTRERFDKRDEREKRWGIEQAMAKADFVISNEGTLDEYQKDVKRVLEEIIRM